MTTTVTVNSIGRLNYRATQLTEDGLKKGLELGIIKQTATLVEPFVAYSSEVTEQQYAIIFNLKETR